MKLSPSCTEKCSFQHEGNFISNQTGVCASMNNLGIARFCFSFLWSWNVAFDFFMLGENHIGVKFKCDARGKAYHQLLNTYRHQAVWYTYTTSLFMFNIFIHLPQCNTVSVQDADFSPTSKTGISGSHWLQCFINLVNWFNVSHQID